MFFIWELIQLQLSSFQLLFPRYFNNNKQLFLNEIVFRFRKDIVSPRKPGFEIYSPRKVSGCRGFVVTCIGYYNKLILPFHFASGEGVLPYICYIGMYALKGYGFSEILVRKRVSVLVILAGTLERGPVQPRPFFCAFQFVVSDAVYFLFRKEVVNVTTVVY